MNFLDSHVQMPLLRLPVRSVVISFGDKRILLSPGSKLTAEELRSAGEVTDLVAPSLFHGGGMKQACEVFPKARVWGVPGLKEQKPEIPWTDVLTETHWAYQAELPMRMLEGIPKVNEAVFFDPSSKSLLVTDLCFHLIDANGFGPWLILTMFGTYRRFGISKFFLKFVTDRQAFAASLRRVLAWPFENIVMAHGHPVRGHGKDLLRRALRERGLPDSP